MSAIVGIKLENRVDSAQMLQQIATEFGCSIKTRIGLHGASDNVCSPDGVILFEIINKDVVGDFVNALQAIEGANVQKMEF